MEQQAERPELVWEELDSSRSEGGMFKLDWKVHRAKVPGGWLVLVMHNASGITFFPDPEHKWDGGSLV